MVCGFLAVLLDGFEAGARRRAFAAFLGRALERAFTRALGRAFDRAFDRVFDRAWPARFLALPVFDFVVPRRFPARFFAIAELLDPAFVSDL
jgi:hypothetical protein